MTGIPETLHDYPGIDLFEKEEDKAVYQGVLDLLRETNLPARMKVGEILEQVSRSTGRKESTVYKVIWTASKSPASPIASTGRGRGSGYYYSSTKVISDGASETGTVVVESKTIFRESMIWPLVAMWFREYKGYHRGSHHVANKKLGGQWGNPDVVALNIVDRVGFYDVEIATAEVKQSDLNWRQWFFEATSHKRLSERSYFVFVTLEDDYDLEEDFYIYAEKFGVGVVIIELDKDQQEKLRNWEDLSEANKLQLVDQVNERIPAPFSPMSPREKADFLQQIGINQKDDLLRWGDG